MLKKYLFIALLVGLGFGQDEYPYFSDMSKQLEFEKKRIIIEEGESTQQIITGGGSEFNPWSLLTISPDLKLPYLRDALPAYKNAPIETHYEYHSFFNIQRDGKDISEIEMLKIIGLEQQADKIISDLKMQVKQFEDKRTNYENLMIKYNNELKTFNYNFYNRDIDISTTILFVSGFIFCIASIPNENKLLFVGGIAQLAFGLDKSIKEHDLLYLKKPQPPNQNLYPKTEPVLQQQLNTAQTKSMVEAYNRKLYSDIANKQ